MQKQEASVLLSKCPLYVVARTICNYYHAHRWQKTRITPASLDCLLPGLYCKMYSQECGVHEKSTRYTLNKEWY